MKIEEPFGDEFFADYAALHAGTMSQEEFDRRFHARNEPHGLVGGVFGARWAAQQAWASAKISGWVPDARAERDWAEYTDGKISSEVFLERAHRAAKAIEDRARPAPAPSPR